MSLLIQYFSSNCNKTKFMSKMLDFCWEKSFDEDISYYIFSIRVEDSKLYLFLFLFFLFLNLRLGLA